MVKWYKDGNFSDPVELNGIEKEKENNDLYYDLLYPRGAIKGIKVTKADLSDFVDFDNDWWF